LKANSRGEREEEEVIHVEGSCLLFSFDVVWKKGKTIAGELTTRRDSTRAIEDAIKTKNKSRG